MSNNHFVGITGSLSGPGCSAVLGGLRVLRKLDFDHFQGQLGRLGRGQGLGLS